VAQRVGAVEEMAIEHPVVAMKFPNPIIIEDAQWIYTRYRDRLSQLAGSRILLTGASGFLCSYLVDVLAVWSKLQLRVVAVDNFIAASRDRLSHLAVSSAVELMTHDVTKPIPLNGPIDYIIHGASIASPVHYRRLPLETINVNVEGTARMLELARSSQAKSMLFLSSSEIYGDPEPQFIPTSEEYNGNVSCTGPRACYDESKRLGETLCATYFRLYATPVKTIRPFNVYGPGQRLDDQRIIPDLVSAALNGGPIKLFSDGRPTRSFCYARDFAAALLLVLLSSENGEAFNIGNDEEISIRAAAETVAELGPNGAPLKVEHTVSGDRDYLTDNPNRRCPDLSKIRLRLGWNPEVKFRDGIARTIRSYRL
jgi:dTDP-glucose 4,6-dehydratase/UDP-glucuronate decarboxylase